MLGKSVRRLWEFVGCLALHSVPPVHSPSCSDQESAKQNSAQDQQSQGLPDTYRW